MRFFKNRALAFYVGFALIMTMAIGGVAVGAFADGGGTATAGVTGQAGVTETDTFSPSFTTQLTGGTDQKITVVKGLSMNVTDATGTGDGWHTTIQATAFNCTSGACLGTSSPHITGQPYLDPADQNATTQTGPLYLTNEAAACVTPSSDTCTQPTPTAGPATVVATTSTAAPFYSATYNTGMGVSTVTADLTLIVPGNTFAGGYSSTVTLAVTSGP